MIALVVGLTLGIVAFFTHELFTSWSYQAMADVKIQDTQMDLSFKLKLLYTAIWAVFPFFVLTVLLIGKFNEKRHALFIGISTFISGIIFWGFKIYSLNLRYAEITQVKIPFPITFYFAREDLNLELYVLVGFVVGAILSGIALHRFLKRGK